MKRKVSPRFRQMKRVALAVTLLSATGCAGGGGPSLSSLNPFSNAPEATLSDQSPGAPASSPGITDRVASTTQNARGQVSSMTSAVKNAYQKTADGITGIFNGGSNEVVDGAGNAIPADDPLRLDNAPKSIGPEVFVTNGQVWEASGNLDKAMENYAKGLDREPNNAPALASVARLKFRQSLFEESSQYFKRATEAAPNDASLYNDWGLALSKLGQHGEAAQTIQKALAIAPRTSRYANNLAMVQYTAGQPQQALTTLKQHNKPAVAHFNMAYLEFNQGNYSAARTQLGEALKFEPQAEEDTAVRRAVERSRELLAKLDGPAKQIANVAQAAPQAYDAIGQLTQAARQVVPAGATENSQQADKPAGNQGDAAPVQQQMTDVQSNALATQPTQPDPPSASPQATEGFQLPPEFMAPSTPQTANLSDEERR